MKLAVRPNNAPVGVEVVVKDAIPCRVAVTIHSAPDEQLDELGNMVACDEPDPTLGCRILAYLTVGSSLHAKNLGHVDDLALALLDEEVTGRSVLLIQPPKHLSECE